jgi:hypothetical protein
MSMASSSFSTVVNMPTTTSEDPLSQVIPPRRKLPWRKYTTPTEDLLAFKYEGQGTDANPYIVDWLDDDAENPQHWKSVSRAL